MVLVISVQKDEPDAFKELGTGNRIATCLFYVSDRPFGPALTFFYLLKFDFYYTNCLCWY